MGIKNVIVVGGLLGVFTACTGNPNDTKLQYFPDMADSPAFKTQGNYIDPPEGSIARSAILYPDTKEESETLLQNPYQGQAEKHLQNGEHLFNIYCSVCHGPRAKGDGNITDKFPRPPDLTMDMYKAKKDGSLFHTITFGSALMPSYGHATTANERWEIILYLRTLQNAPPALPEVKPAPVPEPTGSASPAGESSGAAASEPANPPAKDAPAPDASNPPKPGPEPTGTPAKDTPAPKQDGVQK